MERTAGDLLNDPEFAGFVAGAGLRDALVAEVVEEIEEITRDHDERRRTFVRRCRSMAAKGAITASGAAIAVLYSRHQIELPPAERQRLADWGIKNAQELWQWLPWYAVVVVAVPAVVVAAAALRLAAGYVLFLRTEARRRRAALLEPTRVALRLAISQLADDADEPLLKLVSAPGLSAASDALHRVERPEIQRLIAYMRQFGASAVAISGPRGVGKSTLLRSLAHREGGPVDLVIQVEAAAACPARDFTILLYRALCETVVERIRQEGRWWWPANGDLHHLPRRHGSRRMRQRAQAESERLRVVQNMSYEMNGSVNFRGVLTLGGKQTRQLNEQPLSLPDLVRSFRSFAGDVAAWWSETRPGSGRLVIVIDELDRINDAEDAEKFINEIKGIFGVPRCTYFVTISDDALAMFERRRVGTRPALDSSFDEVVRLGIMDLDSSIDLLSRRLVGCPRPFMALCHALSGGLPRELIRTARAVIDNSSPSERGLAPLTRRTVAEEIQKLKFGFVPRLRGDTASGPINNVLRLLADDGWPGTSAKEMVQHGSELIDREPTGQPDRDQACLELGVSLWYYATILETFGQSDDSAGRRLLELSEVAGRLAFIRSVIPQSIQLALQRLIDLRNELELTVPAGGGSAGGFTR